jgi:hypothetical protein
MRAEASGVASARSRPIQAGDERFSTCTAVGTELVVAVSIMRYSAEDDFGLPETAFRLPVLHIDAPAALGRRGSGHAGSPPCLPVVTLSASSQRTSTPRPVSFGQFAPGLFLAGIFNTGRILARSWEQSRAPSWLKLTASPRLRFRSQEEPTWAR